MVLSFPSPDVDVACTIGPIVRQSSAGNGSLRQALSLMQKARFKNIQLDFSLAGLRPRDLSSGDRKELLSLILRNNLQPTGADLFLPRQDYINPERVDRAVSATLAGIALAGDLGRLPLSLSLPVSQIGTDIRTAILTAADALGVPVAVHAEDQLDDLESWVTQSSLPMLGVGLDPASLLAKDSSGLEPSKVVHRFSKHLFAPRLSDWNTGTGTRAALEQGELNLLQYRIALDLAPNRRSPAILDVRGLENPWAGAQAGKTAWESLNPF